MTLFFGASNKLLVATHRIKTQAAGPHVLPVCPQAAKAFRLGR
jgi:hypothetical protein